MDEVEPSKIILSDEDHKNCCNFIFLRQCTKSRRMAEHSCGINALTIVSGNSLRRVDSKAIVRDRNKSLIHSSVEAKMVFFLAIDRFVLKGQNGDNFIFARRGLEKVNRKTLCQLVSTWLMAKILQILIFQ